MTAPRVVRLYAATATAAGPVSIQVGPADLASRDWMMLESSRQFMSHPMALCRDHFLRRPYREGEFCAWLAAVLNHEAALAFREGLMPATEFQVDAV